MVQPAHTAHACRFCRQKRSKCDGKTPCDGCRRRDSDCVYDDRTKETKSDLRKQLDELQSRDQDVDTVFQALRSCDLTEETMASLWSRIPLDQIAAPLRSSSPILISDEQAQAPRTCEASSSKTIIEESVDTSHVVLSPTTATFSPHYPPTCPSILLNRSTPLPGQEVRRDGVKRHPTIFKPPEEPWGLVGLSSYEVQKLLDVFFDWQYVPLFAVNRKSMERTFFEGKGDNCSPALLRSILCLACRCLDGYDAKSSFYVNLGGRLSQETMSLLYDKKEGDLSDAQACGLLAIHQLGSHEKSDAVFLIEKCVEMLIRMARNSSTAEVWDPSIIGWTSSPNTCLHGAIALCRIIHLFFKCLHAHAGSEYSPKNSRPIDESVVQVLRMPTIAEPAEDQHQFPALLVKMTSAVYCFLTTVDHPVLECPSELLNVYRGFLSLYRGMIAELQSLQASRTSMLFTHLVYHSSLLCLMRPFCHVAKPDAPVNFRTVCLEEAQAILALSTSYQDLVLNRQLPVFVPLFVYAAGLVSFELVGNSPPGPWAHLQHDSSFGTETSSKGRKSIDPSGTYPGTMPLSTSLGSAKQTGLTPDLDRSGKWKLGKISDSPISHPIRTLASSCAIDAINRLSTMVEFFPVARDGREHLHRLMSGTKAVNLTAKDVGYGFP